MMSETKIEWADKVWNPVTGCTKISEGCQNCYAEKMSKRLRGRFGYPKDEPFKVTLRRDRLSEPSKWKKPRRIFVCSMGDLFHDDVWDGFIWQFFNEMRRANHHTFLVLTKRPKRMRAWFAWIEKEMREFFDFAWPLPNVHIGVTAENQAQANARIPILLETPAAKRFVSIEPMLGPIDLNERELICKTWRKGLTIGTYLDGVILGGESGHGARPMHPEWARAVRDQCQEAEVPFFFKQWGEWAPHHLDAGINYDKIALFNKQENGDEPIYIRDLEEDRQEDWTEGQADDVFMYRIGKKKAGALLDGREHKELA